MDGFDSSEAPPEYQQIQWIIQPLLVVMSLGWLVHYVLMIYTSIRDKTYCMTITTLCCNFAWEAVYGLIYPSKVLHERIGFVSGLLFNLAVMYTASVYGRAEWRHFPIAMRNMHLVFAFGVAFWLTTHLVLVAEIGHAVAYTVGAILCQVFISIDGLCLLFIRGRSRGASYSLWFTRFLGSFCAACAARLRYVYWPQSFDFLASPLMLWAIGVYNVCEVLYVVCLYYVKRHERSVRDAELKRK